MAAFLWGGGGAFLRLFLQMATQIVLARVLGPEQYGLFAMGVMVMSFSAFFSDVGIAYGLIQRKELDSTHIRFVFTWQLVLGTAVAVMLASLSGMLANFFNEPRMALVILVLAPLTLLQAASAVSLNLLKRELDYKSLQIAQTIAYFCAYVCLGIPLALAGAQVWALIVAWMVQTLLSLLLMYRSIRHPLRLLFRHADARSMGSFGGTVLLTNLTNWFLSNIDRVVLARVHTSVSVGLYANAYNLVNTPSSTFMGFIQSVMYSACAKVQDDPGRIRKAYLILMAGITLTIMPVFVAMATIADTMVLALYGQHWAPAADVLRPVALAMPFALLWGITTPVLWNSGRTTLEFKLQLPLAGVWLLSALVAVQYSLAALAWTVLGLFVLRTLLFTAITTRTLRLGATDFVEALRGGLVLSALVSLIAWGVDDLLATWHVSAPIRLVGVIGSCGLTVMLALRWLPGLIAALLGDLLEPALARLPRSATRIARWTLAAQMRGAQLK